MEHPVTEMVSAVDIVREQIRIAAGEPLSITQADVQLRATPLAAVSAPKILHHFMPGSGRLQRCGCPPVPVCEWTPSLRWLPNARAIRSDHCACDRLGYRS